MTLPAPHILESPRLPALYAAILRYAGVPTPPKSTTDHFTVRSGAEPPGLLAALLEEAMLDDAAEAVGGGGWPGSLSVVAGFGSSCPNADALRGAARAGSGAVQLFAVERHDEDGRLRKVTWVAVPEEEPPATGVYRAAMLRVDVGGEPARQWQ
jgi:hypothetical protein